MSLKVCCAIRFLSLIDRPTVSYSPRRRVPENCIFMPFPRWFCCAAKVVNHCAKIAIGFFQWHLTPNSVTQRPPANRLDLGNAEEDLRLEHNEINPEASLLFETFLPITRSDKKIYHERWGEDNFNIHSTGLSCDCLVFLKLLLPLCSFWGEVVATCD